MGWMYQDKNAAQVSACSGWIVFIINTGNAKERLL